MYFYHADAFALGGILVRPSRQTIATQAGTTLPTVGGESSTQVGKFDNGLISFDSAQSKLTGSVETRNGSDVNVTGVSVAIERLNIRNIVTADRIVARLAAEQARGDSEPSIFTTGSHVDNLRIAGYPVAVETMHDVFHSFPTYRSLQAAWEGGKQSRLQSALLGSTLPAIPAAHEPKDLREVHDTYQKQKSLSHLRHTVQCSFVKSVEGLEGSEIRNWGPIIVIPQFGTIYLGEVIISPGVRRLNMLRLELGSPIAGSLAVGGATCGGLSGDPTVPDP